MDKGDILLFGVGKKQNFPVSFLFSFPSGYPGGLTTQQYVDYTLKDANARTYHVPLNIPTNAGPSLFSPTGPNTSHPRLAGRCLGIQMHPFQAVIVFAANPLSSVYNSETSENAGCNKPREICC